MLQAVNSFIRVPAHIAYYRNVHLPLIVSKLCYRFKGQPIIYGIRCRATDKIYIGSTFVPSDRFYKHLVKGDRSNIALQEAIVKHGLEWFTVYVFEVVKFPSELGYLGKKLYLRDLEQQYIDRFPEAQLYNSIRSAKRSIS